MILYHGTTTLHLPNILEKGLESPYLTSSLSLAEYYAETASEEDGGEGIVLTLEVDTEQLRYDGNAMDEPVGFDDYTISGLEEEVQKMYNQLKKSNPSWIKNGYICIPKDQYKISLDTVSSCYYEGVVAPTSIIEYEEI